MGLSGPEPVFLLAPKQISKRRLEWGRLGFEDAVGGVWNQFVPWTDSWLTVRRASGAHEVAAAYQDLLDGRVDPRTGHACALSEAAHG